MTSRQFDDVTKLDAPQEHESAATPPSEARRRRAFHSDHEIPGSLPAEEVARATSLYDEFAKSLEGVHWGEFVAISPHGRICLGATLLEAVEAATKLGPGSVVFRVGERVVGTWR